MRNETLRDPDLLLQRQRVVDLRVERRVPGRRGRRLRFLGPGEQAGGLARPALVRRVARDGDARPERATRVLPHRGVERALEVRGAREVWVPDHM